jgi:hypothetical protein
MRIVDGQHKKMPDTRSITGQRAGLLRKIQVAKAQSKMPDLIYRDILRERFGVETSKALSIGEMEKLVAIFIDEWGWVPSYHEKHGPSQIAALEERIWQLASEIHKPVLPGLCKSILEVDQVEWCKDWRKLRRLVAVLENIRRKEGSHG